MNLAPDMRQGLAKRRQRSLVLEVRDELERMILDGQVPAGERLNECVLAEQMGVSRGPVREAARSLERDGLVTTVSNRGVFVREFSVADALELFDLRATLAGYVCESVAMTASQTCKAKLRASVERMARCLACGDEEEYFSANHMFHDMLARASRQKRTASLYIAFGKEVRLLRHQFPCGEAQLLGSNAEHERIVSAIECGDGIAARKEGTAHHLNGKRRLLEALSGRMTNIEYPVNRAGSHHDDLEPHRKVQSREV